MLINLSNIVKKKQKQRTANVHTIFQNKCNCKLPLIILINQLIFIKIIAFKIGLTVCLIFQLNPFQVDGLLRHSNNTFCIFAATIFFSNAVVIRLV